jgi:hypothetical protein
LSAASLFSSYLLLHDGVRRLLRPGKSSATVSCYGIVIYGYGTMRAQDLGLADNTGVGANTVVFKLDLLNNRGNFGVKDLELPVEIYVLSKVPE